jgi:elongation factor Ts
MEKAIDSLRKQGLAKAAKKAGRTAAEGLVNCLVSGDAVVLSEVSCETDFVCKTDEFQKFTADIANHIAKTKPAGLDTLLGSTMNGRKIADTQIEMVARIGENLGVRRFVIKDLNGKGVKLGQYVHAGSKIGTIVLFDDPNGKLTIEAARDVAMHVAAMNPHFVRKSDVPADVQEREKEVYRGQMANEKKPPEVLEKIILGKLGKYLSEICLEDQIFVRDATGKQTVSAMLKALDPAIKIREFVRYQVGEAAK